MKEKKVVALWYTPIKGTKGTWLREPGKGLFVGKRGIYHDRMWLVVENGMFVAQRKGSPSYTPRIVDKAIRPLGLGIEVRTMCQVAPRVEGKELIISAPHMSDLHLPVYGIEGGEETLVAVWRDHKLAAIDQGARAQTWFTKFLSRERPGKYRLVRMAEDCIRQSKTGGAIMGFHDGLPFMMISQMSLNLLNEKLSLKGEEPVPPDQFRPNIWIEGCEAHEEDHLALLQIGEVRLKGRTLCDRCVVTCTNQETGERGREPLATLATYRRGIHIGVTEKPNAVFFGRNFTHLNTGVISVGDTVHVLKRD